MLSDIGTRLLATLVPSIEASAQGCYYEYRCLGGTIRQRRRCCSDNTHPPSCSGWVTIGGC